MTFGLPLHLLSLAVLAFPAQLASQERSAEVQQRNDCRLAVQVLVHGQPAKKYDWAIGIAEDCGTAGADAIAHELRDLRSLSRRTPHLEQLQQIAHRNIDIALYEAAMDIAADGTAGEAARIHAISLIALQVASVNRSYEALTVDLMSGEPIKLAAVVSEGPLRFRDLPPTACADAFALLERLAGDDNPTVRVAARRASYPVEAECVGTEADHL